MPGERAKRSMKADGFRFFFSITLISLLPWAGNGWAGQASILNRIENEIASILEENRDGVVRIHSLYNSSGEDEGLQYGRGFVHGTGFVIDSNGHILTVDKAVARAEEIRVTLTTGEQALANFIASDPASEVAVIRIAREDLSPITPGNSDRVRIGHYTFILGNTFGNLTPSFGSTHSINPDGSLFQIVSRVHPGYGGAPVFCSTGEVIGMVWSATDAWVGAHTSGSGRPLAGLQDIPRSVFVIPINRALQTARRLVAERDTGSGWLGVEGEFDPAKGFSVTDVDSGGPAQACGVRLGDLIISYQSTQIRSGEHLKSMVLSTPPGTSVRMRIRRGSKPMTPRVEIGRLANLTSGGSPPPEMLQVDHNREVLFQRMQKLEQEMSALRHQLQKK